MEDWAELKARGLSRVERLRHLTQKLGRYAPSLYETSVDERSGLAVVRQPEDAAIPYPVQRSFLPGIEAYPFPTDTPVILP